MSEQAVITPPVDVQPNVHVGNTDVSRGTDAVVKQEPDILSEVSKFRKSSPTSQSSKDNQDFFDYKQIEEIKDPIAKEVAIKAYKSMQSGLTQKTQAIAEERKKLESKMQEMQNWSPERIQRELLNNPQFLQAAQQIAATSPQNPPNSGLTNEEFSALTAKEQAQLAELKQQVNLLQQTNYQARMQQEHSQLQQKYADYDPQEVTQLWNDLSTGKIQATNEHLYKVANYERAVKAAYEYGIQQSKQLNQERSNGSSLNGLQVDNSTGLPVREKGERDESFFVKLAKFRAAQRRK
jgi:hypothetical protein